MFFQKVQEAEEEIAHKERQYDLSRSTTDRVVFSEARARLLYALLYFHAMIQKKCQLYVLCSMLFYVHRIQDAFSIWLSEPSIIADTAVKFRWQNMVPFLLGLQNKMT